MKAFEPIQFPVIGMMHSPFREKFGIPRQPNLVNIETYIQLCAPYNNISAFDGIEEFSHLWLLWHFHENKNLNQSNFRPQVRPPRLGGNQRKGVFATRSMYRPAPIGMSVVQLNRIECVGKELRVYVMGSDLLHGTPILDIKPYVHYSDAIDNAQSGYADIQPQIKPVIWSDNASQQCQSLIVDGLTTLKIIESLEQVLALDPRPAYQHDEQRLYGMSFDQLNVQFQVKEENVFVVSVCTVF